MSSHTPGQTPYYYVPAESGRPFWSAFFLFFVILGASQWVNGVAWGKWSLLVGLAGWLSVLFFWMRDAARESEQGLFGHKVDYSYRWSMSWFIFSEVMFFGAFFTALWWGRANALPNLANVENALLWPGFNGCWPSSAAGAAVGATGSPANTIEPFMPMMPVADAAVWAQSWFKGLMGSLPTINTLILLTSGVTLTIAHHALLQDNRPKTIRFMWATVLLGIIFLFFQGYEYHHAYSEMNLKLSSGMYGSTFFMLTGFHGFHVFLGMLMLLFITLRLQNGHFTSKRHFGFEGAAWYWHFVDVVWLLLYILVYWL